MIKLEKTERKFKCILLSDSSQSEEATYYIIPTIWHPGKGKTMKFSSCQGLGAEEMNTESTEDFLGQ